MELEKQLTSLEPSKRLAELGVKQESLFYWTDGMRYDGAYDLVYKHAPMVKEGGGKITTISAFTVAELGEMLPDFITEAHLYTYQQYRNWADKKKPKHGVSYWFMGREELHFTEADTEANARAKMLIYLLENNLISLPA